MIDARPCVWRFFLCITMEFTIKKELLDFCVAKNKDRIKDIVLAMEHAQDAIENDTKSSAGDKYETTREMVQQDLNRYQDQLAQAKKDAVVLQQLELDVKTSGAVGAVVVTDKASYFIAISLGKQYIAANDYMIISASSPIGKLLLGKVIGEVIVFNGNSQTIQAIY